MHSGVPLFDDWLAGVRDGGLHLLTGGPGSGQSTVALEFADAGLRRGEPVAMVVHARAADVLSHAQYIGVELRKPLRDGRLLLLRYRPDFLEHASHAGAPDDVITDLERLVASHRPRRIVIDTFSPLVSVGPPVIGAATALAHLLERTKTASLLTFPEELAEGYDRSLEPIVQNAAVVIRLVREDADVRRAELLSSRAPSPEVATKRFVIREGRGVVSDHAIRTERLTLRAP